MKRVESILIHAGSGGVGRAIISVALHADLTSNGDKESLQKTVKLVTEGIKLGAFRPLPTSVYNEQ